MGQVNVNTPSGNDGDSSGAGFILGIIVAIIVIAALVYFLVLNGGNGDDNGGTDNGGTDNGNGDEVLPSTDDGGGEVAPSGWVLVTRA